MRNTSAIAPKNPWLHLHPFTYTAVLWCGFAFLIRNFTYKTAYMHPHGYPLQEMGWPYPMMRYEPWNGYIHWSWDAIYYEIIFLGWGLLAVGVLMELLMQVTSYLSQKIRPKVNAKHFKNHKAKSWFKLHLSTTIIVMFTAGIIMWANMRHSSQPSIQLDSGQLLYEYGWPCHAIFGPYEVRPAYFRKAQSARWLTGMDSEFLFYWLLPNGLTALTALVLTSSLAEVAIRIKKRGMICRTS